MTRPVIRHDQGMIHCAVDATIEATSKDFGIYVWSGSLHKIHVTPKQETVGGVTRPKGSIVLVPMTVPCFVEIATKAATHVKYDSRKKDDVVINCPRSVPEMILARGHWTEYPTLSGISEHATLDEDARLIDSPDYDKKTGLYLAVSAPLPTPSARGRSGGKWGLQKILDSIRTFPFVSQADKSAAVACVMTALLRRILPSAPMFAVTAPTPGTGKTLLTEFVSLILTGRRPPVISIGSDENEFSKRVYGVLLAGDSLLVMDNIVRPIGNEDVLNQLLTSPTLRFRPLGSPGMVSAPTNLLVMATGNNLAIIGDCKRRTVLIKLDAKQERPEQRTFDIDILKETLSHRDELISAALWISKSYLECSAPEVDAKPVGSFAEWDRMVRRPLIWLGMDDPLAASEPLRESDPDLECMSALFAAWDSTFGDKAVTASDVVKLGQDYNPSSGQYAHSDLHDALQIACRERITGHQLGIWLRKHQDRIIDGRQLVKDGADRNKISRWKVVQI